MRAFLRTDCQRIFSCAGILTNSQAIDRGALSQLPLKLMFSFKGARGLKKPVFFADFEVSIAAREGGSGNWMCRRLQLSKIN